MVATIFVECMGSNTSLDFVRMLHSWALQVGGNVIFSEEEYHHEHILEEYIRQGAPSDIDFEWLCASFPPFRFQRLYDFAMTEHIKIVERIAMRSPTEFFRLLTVCYDTPISDTATIDNVIHYVSWLLSIGRTKPLFEYQLTSLVERLLSALPRSETVIQALLLTVMTTGIYSRQRIITDLFELAVKLLPTSSRLIDMMAETGLLSTAEGRSALLLSTAEDVDSKLSGDTLDLLWRKSVEQPDLKSVVGGARISLEFLCQPRAQYGRTPSLASCTIQAVCRINRVQYFVPSVIGHLSWLGETDSLGGYSRLLGELLMNGKDLVAPIFKEDIDISLMIQVTRSVFRCSEWTLIEKFHAIMLAEPRHRYYLQAANIAMIESIQATGQRGLDILTLLGSHADLNHLRNLHRGYWPDILPELVLQEIKRRPVIDESLREFADLCLSRIVTTTSFHLGIRTSQRGIQLLCNNISLIGDRTLRCLLYETGKRRIKASVWNLVNNYIIRKPHIAVNVILGVFSKGSNAPVFTMIKKIELGRAIQITREILFLGSKMYTRGEGTNLIDSSSMHTGRDMECSICHEALTGRTVFRSADADHGQYSCQTCGVAESTPASCPVCLAESPSVEMKLLECGHGYCPLCITKIVTPESVITCPSCRQLNVLQRRQISQYEAREIFCQEWQSSPGIAQGACQANLSRRLL